MRRLLLTLGSMLMSSAVVTAGVQHGGAAGHDDHAAPAKTAASPSAAPAPSTGAKPAPPPKPAPHSHTTPTSSAKAGESDVRSAIERIQQRIATEVGPVAKPAASRPAAVRTTPPVGQAHAAPAPTAPQTPQRVTLQWRASLVWPSGLLPGLEAVRGPVDPVVLKWQ